jgi:hypothetical protein
MAAVFRSPGVYTQEPPPIEKRYFRSLNRRISIARIFGDRSLAPLRELGL